ncbi:MAG: transposase [Planctomycetia bacterium]|nr:transposase [Planctomycetia bacterium]
MREGWLFQADRRGERLEKIGCKLDLLATRIPWESFREDLETLYKKSPLSGRPPYDAVMMLKILVLQAQYSLSDEEMKYQIVDRISF